MFNLLLETVDAMDSAVAAIMIASLKAAPLVLLLLLLQRLARRWLTPSWRYFMWSLVLLRLAAPDLPESPASLYNLFAPAPPRMEVKPPAVQAPPPAVASLSTSRAVADMGTTQDNARTSGDGPDDPAFQRRAGNIAAIVQSVWLAGFLILGSWMAWTCFRFRWRLRSGRRIDDERTRALLVCCQRRIGVRRRLPVWEVDGLGSPALFGIFRPRLLFPVDFVSTLSDEALKTVLLHELAHLKRRDVLVNWIMTCFQIIHWFNPLVWLAFARMRAARELACDARILAGMDRAESLIYGRTLLDLLERNVRVERLAGLAALVGILEHAADMKERLALIASGPVRRYWKGTLASAALAGLLGCVSLSNPALPSLPHDLKVKVPTRPEPALPSVPQGQSVIPLTDARLLLHAILYSQERGPLDVATFVVNWPADKGRGFKAAMGKTHFMVKLNTVNASTERPELGIRVNRSPYLRVNGSSQIAAKSFGGGAMGTGLFTICDRQPSGGGAMVNGQSLAFCVTLLAQDDPLGEQSLGQFLREHWNSCLEYQLYPFVRTDKTLAPWIAVAGGPLKMPNCDLRKADWKNELDRRGWMLGGQAEFSREMLLDLDSGKTVPFKEKDPWPAGFDARWDPVIKEWWLRPDAKIQAVPLGTAAGDLLAYLDKANRLLGQLDGKGRSGQDEVAMRSPFKAPLVIRTDQGNVFFIEPIGSGSGGGIIGVKSYVNFSWYRHASFKPN